MKKRGQYNIFVKIMLILAVAIFLFYIVRQKFSGVTESIVGG